MDRPEPRQETRWSVIGGKSITYSLSSDGYCSADGPRSHVCENDWQIPQKRADAQGIDLKARSGADVGGPRSPCRLPEAQHRRLR
jgi:hypothetical protein